MDFRVSFVRATKVLSILCSKLKQTTRTPGRGGIGVVALLKHSKDVIRREALDFSAEWKDLVKMFWLAKLLGTEALLKLANRTSIQRTLACEQTLWGGRPYSRSSNLAWMRRWARENAMVARGRREENYYPSRSCVSEFPLYHAVSKQANSYSCESSFMLVFPWINC